MTETKKASKRKIIDWNKKSGEDSSRIAKRMQHRDELKDSASTTNDSSAKFPPRAVGLPLLRLKKKIKEVYDEEEEEDSYTPQFNISLIGEEDELIAKRRKEVDDTLSITKQQQMAGKLGIIMDAALIAEEAGLPAKLTAQDENLATTAENDPRKLRRKILREKVEKPLKLKGELKEKNLTKAAKGLKKAQKALPADALEDFPAENAEELIELDKEDMAKLILKKSGRRGPKKKLSEIAKGLNQFKNFDETEENNKE